MAFSFEYYRDAASVKRFQEHGVMDKPEGWVKGQAVYHKFEQAEADVAHINSRGGQARIRMVSG